MPRMEEPEGQGEQINVAELTPEQAKAEITRRMDDAKRADGSAQAEGGQEPQGAEFDPDHAAVGRIRRAVEVTA